jgi:hypothetical protein
VVGDLTRLQLAEETVPDPDAPPPPVSPFMPASRDGVRWLFSARERAVYMVGGSWQGIPTGEVWRYDLDTSLWRHMFGLVDRHQVLLGEVQALAYDEDRGKLVVLDTLVDASEHLLSRVVVFDTHTETSKIAATVDVSAFSKVGLAARDDSSFVLTGTKWTQGTWSSYQFSLTSTDDVSWQGKAIGTGQVLSDPIFSDLGISLPLQSGNSVTSVDLPREKFTGSGPPPELNVCDHAPSITAPAAITISSCAGANIGTATSTNACGGLPKISNNAPAKFPLGQTVVTWTATDLLGRSATATQLVTATLGNDVSCCPAGTNVIVGTSNNDVITGTAGADCILGLGAQDTLSGGGGNDYISGGDGDDVINGGDGNDTLFGGSGQDRLNGDNGNDVLSGGDGDDICHGGAGADQLFGDLGQDQLFGDADNDQLFGGDGDDTLTGGTGTNSCNGGPGHNTLLQCL